MHEHPVSGYLVKAIDLMQTLPTDVQPQYEELVCDLELADAENLLKEYWGQNLPPVEEIFMFGADDTPDPNLDREVPYARFAQSSLYTLVPSPAMVRLAKTGVPQPVNYAWTMFGLYSQIVQACDGENYTMSLTGHDAKTVIKAINMGIDSHLEAVFGEFHNGERSIIATEDSEYWEKGEKLVLAHTLECEVTPESLPVLLRRLTEDMEWCDGEDCDGEDCDGAVGSSLAESILMTLGFDDCGKFVGREALGLD